MPEGYRKHRVYPSLTLAKAAKDGLLILVRCYLCRGPMVRFLASDLVLNFGGDRDAEFPPFPCSKCGTSEYVRVKFHLPLPGDYGHLEVRRPAGVTRIQKWRTAK